MLTYALNILLTAIIALATTVSGAVSPVSTRVDFAPEPMKIELVIDASGIHSVFYTAYLDGERACSGAAADLDGAELEQGRVLEYLIWPELLGDSADLSGFSIDFTAYDGESPYELGTTNAVAFPAELGQTYRIHLVQAEEGYLAIAEWEDGESDSEKFTLELGGDVQPETADFSYVHIDYYLGDVQYGYMYACVDEGEDVIRVEFPKEAFEGFEDAESPDLSAFRADIYLSYSEYKGDEAVLQAMYGNTGEDEYLTSINIDAAYGETYTYALTGDRASGYELTESVG